MDCSIETYGLTILTKCLDRSTRCAASDPILKEVLILILPKS